jgi:hypothetical protein
VTLCPRYGEYGWDTQCTCQKYRIAQDWSSEQDGSAYEEDPDEVWASDPRAAAEQWARDYDNGDYTIVGGQPERLKIYLDDTRFIEVIVFGENEPVYTSRLITQELKNA